MTLTALERTLDICLKCVQVYWWNSCVEARKVFLIPQKSELRCIHNTRCLVQNMISSLLVISICIPKELFEFENYSIVLHTPLMFIHCSLIWKIFIQLYEVWSYQTPWLQLQLDNDKTKKNYKDQNSNRNETRRHWYKSKTLDTNVTIFVRITTALWAIICLPTLNPPLYTIQ